MQVRPARQPRRSRRPQHHSVTFDLLYLTSERAWRPRMAVTGSGCERRPPTSPGGGGEPELTRCRLVAERRPLDCTLSTGVPAWRAHAAQRYLSTSRSTNALNEQSRSKCRCSRSHRPNEHPSMVIACWTMDRLRIKLFAVYCGAVQPGCCDQKSAPL
jgi:hypothetical protein